MGLVLELVADFKLPPERIAKLSDFDSEFGVLQRENVQLKIEVDTLKQQIAEQGRTNQLLQQENQDLRKTESFLI